MNSPVWNAGLTAGIFGRSPGPGWNLLQSTGTPLTALVSLTGRKNNMYCCEGGSESRTADFLKLSAVIDNREAIMNN